MAAPQGVPGLPAGITRETKRHPPTHKYLPPRPGDDVEVHCVATLKRGGEQFDSSRERGQPVAFKVGQGEVIDGWDRSVQTMRKGEQVRFTVPPEYAYGEAGLEDKVPPNSTIILELELLKCPLREDLFEDGGAVKLELKDGPSNGRQPRNGDECLISYKVTIEDSGVAMASRDAVYKVGGERLGQIAKVIDKALLTMKRGDEAMVTCQPTYAYGNGDGQYAGKVASIFVGLHEIFEVHDVSLGEKDKTVLRKRTKEGEGKDTIHDMATVKIRVTSVTSSSDESPLAEPRELTFVAGDGQVCDAIEGAVIMMRTGDHALLRCSSSEAVAGGLLGLPTELQAPVMIQLQVLSHDKALEKWDLSGEQRIERGRKRKQTAGDLFRQGRVRLAAQHYETIADLFVQLDFFADHERDQAAELRRVANLNLAMCMLQLGNMSLVESLCTRVLSEDALNPKALFRRAKARLAQKDYRTACDDLQRLLEVEPKSTEGRQLLREAKRLDKQNDARQARTFAKMCDGLGTLPERVAQKDDIVVMPNLDEEYARISAECGVPLPSAVGATLGAANASVAATAASAPVATDTATTEVTAVDAATHAPLGEACAATGGTGDSGGGDVGIVGATEKVAA